MKYLIPLCILTMMMLIVSGCDSFGGSGDRGANVNYRTGSQGLTMSFMTNMPPSNIYDDEPFNVLMKVQNSGAEDIRTGSNSRLFLSGFDPNLITGISTSGEDIGDLDGKSMYIPQGEYTLIEFSGTVADLDSRNIDRYPFNLMATLCYNYKTIAEPNVCLDSDPFSTTIRTKACNANLNPSVSTQGAPIAVTSINVEPMRGRVKFDIHISNVGGGTVFRQGYSYLDRCNPYNIDRLEYNDVDVVTVTRVNIANTDIRGTCKPLRNGELRLINGKGFMSCELTGITGPAYTTPLLIELEYGYRQVISRNIAVVATGN